MNAAFVLHPDAEAGLREIVRYTRKQWGEAQARQYTAKLRYCVQALANDKKPYKDMSGVANGALRTPLCFLSAPAGCARFGSGYSTRAHGHCSPPKA